MSFFASGKNTIIIPNFEKEIFDEGETILDKIGYLGRQKR